LSESRIDPLLNLIRNLVVSIEDGSVSADEASSIFEALASVLDSLSLGFDRWYLRWSMRAGAAALREAGEHVTELPGWKGP
jgi:hypothetical protein